MFAEERLKERAEKVRITADPVSMVTESQNMLSLHAEAAKSEYGPACKWISHHHTGTCVGTGGERRELV